jgi:hypothetical protein
MTDPLQITPSEITREMKRWTDVEADRAKNRGNSAEIVRTVSAENAAFQLKFFLNAVYKNMSDADRAWIYDMYYVPYLEVDKQEWAQHNDPRDWPSTGTGNIKDLFSSYVKKCFDAENKIDPSRFPERSFTEAERKKAMAEVDCSKDGKASLLEFLMWRVPDYHPAFASVKGSAMVDFLCQQEQFDVGSGMHIVQAQQGLDDVTKKWADLDAKLATLKETAAAATGIKKTKAANEVEQHEKKYTDILRNTDEQNSFKLVRKAIKTAKDSKSLIAQGAAWFLAYEQTKLRLAMSSKAQARK